MSKSATEIIYYREGLVQSIISDIITFGCLLGIFIFNYYYFENSAWIGTTLVIFTLISIAGRNKANKFNTIQGAIDYLESVKNEEQKTT